MGCCYGEGWMFVAMAWVEEWRSRSGWVGGWSHRFRGRAAGTRVTVVGEVTTWEVRKARPRIDSGIRAPFWLKGRVNGSNKHGLGASLVMLVL